MWAKIIATLTGQTVEAVLAYKTAKRTLKANIELEKLKGKAEYERAKTQRASESEGRDHEWEMESIKNSGWKDEYVLITLSIPMILSFIPYTQPFVVAGFVALDGTPLWYRTTVASIYLATFGLRLWRRDVSKGTNVIDTIKK
jgi:hypothetical protein